MRAYLLYRTAWLVMAGLLLSACTATPSTHFYILDPMTAPARGPVKTGTKRLIGIGPVSLPALLERKQLVTRTGRNAVNIVELHQWAAPLKEHITQILAENLSILLLNDRVNAYPWSAYGTVEYRILVDIIRFDTTPGHTATMEAHWAVMSEKDHSLLANGKTKINRPLPGDAYSDAVHAMSDCLAEFSRQLASALDSLE